MKLIYILCFIVLILLIILTIIISRKNDTQPTVNQLMVYLCQDNNNEPKFCKDLK